MEESKPKKRSFIIAVVLFVLITLASLAGLFYWDLHRYDTPPPPRSVVLAANKNVPLYYPQKLPKGFYINPKDIDVKQSVTAYTIKYDKTKQLFVSIQKTTDAIDFEEFYQKTMAGTREISSFEGKAVVRTIGEKTVASIRIDDIWILITSQDGLDPEQLEHVVQNLRRLQ